MPVKAQASISYTVAEQLVFTRQQHEDETAASVISQAQGFLADCQGKAKPRANSADLFGRAHKPRVDIGKASQLRFKLDQALLMCRQQLERIEHVKNMIVANPTTFQDVDDEGCPVLDGEKLAAFLARLQTRTQVLQRHIGEILPLQRKIMNFF